MAIDHGLGGRDSEKSRTRRERKAKRLRQLSKQLQSEDVPHSRREVKFDENARAAFLTGFHQRKQERRKFGLTMQILREKKFRKEAAKSRNKALEKSSAEARKRDLAIPMPAGSDDEEEDDENDEDGDGNDEEGSVFADDATVSMFGSAVNVVISDAIGDNDDASPFASGHLRALAAGEDSDEEEDGEGEGDEDDSDTRSVSSRLSASSAASAHRKRGKKELSNFERAMKKVKQTMGSRKKKRHNVEKNPHRSKHQRKVEKKTESRKLLTKYLGSKGISLKKRKD